jgi:hypothetical protein
MSETNCYQISVSALSFSNFLEKQEIGNNLCAGKEILRELFEANKERTIF